MNNKSIKLFFILFIFLTKIVSAAEALAEKRIVPNTFEKESANALLKRAVNSGSVVLAEFALKRGADPNLLVGNYFPPHPVSRYAVNDNFYDELSSQPKYLASRLRRGCWCFFRKEQETVLKKTIKRHSLKVAKLLVKYGATLGYDREKPSALHLLVTCNTSQKTSVINRKQHEEDIKEIIKIAIERGICDKNNPDTKSIVQFAVSNSYLDLLQLICGRNKEICKIIGRLYQKGENIAPIIKFMKGFLKKGIIMTLEKIQATESYFLPSDILNIIANDIVDLYFVIEEED